MVFRAVFLGFAAFLLVASSALAADAVEHRLSLKNKAFVPAELKVPAGQKIKLIVKNEDSAAIEFESHDLNREKVIPANSESVIYIGPLDAGSYAIFDEFHPETTGKITAQ